ncbi:CCM1 [Symbiodinium sp. KB8]|nr:CCM1 [Symbiodinium sp. KB8]
MGGAQGCDEMEVQVTSWSNLNPRFWAPRGFGVTDLVLPNTSMKGVYLRRCGEPIFQQGLTNPLEIDIDISQPEGVYPGYLVEFMCAAFDEGLGAWSTAGMSLKHAITNVSTEMTCLATRSSGLFAALYRVVREEPPNTTTPLPPPPEVDEGLTLGALLAIVGGGTVLLCGCVGGLYAWHKMRSREPVEPEPEEEEEEAVETESESEIAELPDPDPALTKLRLAAEAGTLTAREILANHSGPMGIRQELVWALDKGYEKKRREAQAKDEVGSDLVSWEKFKDLAAKKPRQPEKQAHALLQAFQAFDQSGSGQVDMKELRHIVTNLGEKLTTKEFEEICKAADLPAAGALDYKKVVDKVTKT